MNRFLIEASAVNKVIKHLRSRRGARDDEKQAVVGEGVGKITANDIGLPKWAHKLKSPSVRKLAHGRLALFDGPKRVVSHDLVDDVLRELMLSSESDVPLSRDSGYYVIQQRYIGISRRALMGFLAKQTDLQLTQNRLGETKKKGPELHHKGILEADLIEGKKKDVRGLGKGYDWYWLTVIDRLTGYLDVEHLRHKTAKGAGAMVPPAMERILDRMEARLGTPIKRLFTDDGAEFKAGTKTLLDERNIKHLVVARGNRIEKANGTFQRIFYRLYRLKRGTFGQLTQQALAMFNNTRTIHGRTPTEALNVDDRTLATPYNQRRQAPSIAKGPGTGKLRVGDPVRYLLKPRHKVLFYKTYRGQHYSLETVRISALSHDVPTRYHLGAVGWKHRDELLHAPSDPVTEGLLRNKRHARH